MYSELNSGNYVARSEKRLPSASKVTKSALDFEPDEKAIDTRHRFDLDVRSHILQEWDINSCRCWVIWTR